MFKTKILLTGVNPKQTRLIQEDTGVAQGNILSPILCNIYLDDLDRFIERIIERHRKGARATRSLEYARATQAPASEKKENLDPATRLARQRERRKEAHRRGLRYTEIDDKFTRVKYVRYADDFIVGVRGPKSLATKLRKEIE